jgi:hypothetical protein
MLTNQHAALPQMKAKRTAKLWKENPDTLHQKESDNQDATTVIEQDAFHSAALSIKRAQG